MGTDEEDGMIWFQILTEVTKNINPKKENDLPQKNARNTKIRI